MNVCYELYRGIHYEWYCFYRGQDLIRGMSLYAQALQAVRGCDTWYVIILQHAQALRAVRGCDMWYVIVLQHAQALRAVR